MIRSHKMKRNRAKLDRETNCLDRILKYISVIASKPLKRPRNLENYHKLAHRPLFKTAKYLF